MPQGPATVPPQQLSLFDEAVPSLPSSAAPAPSQPPSQPQTSAVAQPAPTAPASTVAPATAPPEFRHPRSQRDIHLAGHRVAYELRRSRRRSIGFVVGAEGLAVSAPRWVGVGEIEAVLREKAAWILRKLHEQRERGRRLDAARVDWRDGTVLPFLGESVILVLDGRITGAVLHEAAETLPGVPRLTLHLGLPHGAEPAQIRDAVQSWLQRQARALFEQRCALLAERLGVRMKRLSLSSASTRWGSASADGSIRLNWRLVHFALPVIDYVVAHELAHLREMNHSPAFWDVVRSAVPDYEAARGSLRHEVLPVFD
ncbi:MAG: metal-dependent hydrolase [Leptothrix sp. (in: Bacteria)]|nr:metal-dependent hydrolase [Leptothrix sp. (in: b-proteobacteria)]